MCPYQEVRKKKQHGEYKDNIKKEINIKTKIKTKNYKDKWSLFKQSNKNTTNKNLTGLMVREGGEKQRRTKGGREKRHRLLISILKNRTSLKSILRH